MELEAELLRRNGHDVDRLSVWTGELNGASALKMLSVGFGTVWSLSGYSKTKSAIRRFSPDVVHVHNTFPLLSPSVYWAAHRAGVPVVQTLHNFRFTCANALLLRNDKPCQKCVGRSPLPALWYRCYRESVLQTAAVCSTNIVHRLLGTYQTKVQAYIVLTEFSREIMTRCGLPRQRIHVKPNFNSDPQLTSVRRRRIVFVGEVSRAKGVHLLLEAWARLDPPGYELMIVGDGPIRAQFEHDSGSKGTISWGGPQSRDKVLELVAGSRWLCLPSLAYENLPMTLLEAFSVGTPVVVPDHGPFPVIVGDGKQGLLFRPGNATSLAQSIDRAMQMNEATWADYSSRSRDMFLRQYTERTNYEQLIRIYQHAVDRFGPGPSFAGRLPAPQAAFEETDLPLRNS